jgi:hypothetical protein
MNKKRKKQKFSTSEHPYSSVELLLPVLQHISVESLIVCRSGDIAQRQREHTKCLSSALLTQELVKQTR